MTFPNQIRPERPKVVNLPVADNPQSPVLVADWLVAARQIDDAEPSHGQPNVSIDVEPLVVGASMFDGSVHPTKNFDIHCLRFIEVNYPVYSAHHLTVTVFFALDKNRADRYRETCAITSQRSSALARWRR
jgi:hypothetical protein